MGEAIQTETVPVEGYPTSATGLASGTIARMADRAARGLLNGGNYR